jgi:CheY-like chemotaxis protein
MAEGRITAAEVRHQKSCRIVGFQNRNDSQPGSFYPRRLQCRSGGYAMEHLAAILVVEDDTSIQAVVEEALSDGGFEIVISSSGENATELLGATDAKFRALVTDIDLDRDKLDGWELADAPERSIQHFRLSICGSNAEDWASKGVPHSVMIAKPFAPAQLVTAVAQLLNAIPPVAPEK